MKQYTDQINRIVPIHKVPQRIVSLVPSQSELLADLGLEAQLVGVTKFCVHPAKLRKEKQVVGGTKKIHLEKVKALRPDIILCNKEENTQEMVEQLEDVAPVHVSDVKDLSESLLLIQQYGELFQVQSKAEELLGEIEQRANVFRERNSTRPWRKVAYLIWKGPWMAAGADTFIDALLRINHFENIFAEEASRYPEIGITDLRKMEPGLLLLSTEPFPFKQKHIEELQAQLPGWELKIVDGEYFSWYGSRLLEAFDYFQELQESLDVL